MVSRKKIRFIINPASGAKSKEHFPEWIDEMIDKENFEAEICFTNAPGHATELAREAATLKIEIVVAVGGDGSVNETAAGLLGTDSALGIIPTGSGNGMARHLKVPMDFKKAVRSIQSSVPERIDTVRVNDHFCIGTFGIGFDAHIAHLFSKAPSRGYSTYVKLVLREFNKYPAHQYNLVVDGKSVSRSSFLLTFANSSQFGNNAVIAPFADVQDGIVEISFIQKFPFTKAPHLIYRMMNNSLHHSKYFEGMRAKEITIINEGELKAHIDGEPIHLKGNIKVTVLPLSLHVLVPKQ